MLNRLETNNGVAGARRSFVYLSSQVVGDLGTDGLSDEIDYAEQLVNDQSAANSGSNTYNTPVVGANANFDTYVPFNSASVDQAGSSNTATGGETLYAVAQTLWGDSSLWYLLAEANGLNAASVLMAGQSLSVPSQVTNARNAADTFKPYDPVDAMGNTNPTQPQPPAPKKKGCGTFGTILAVVVAVVVVYLTRSIDVGSKILKGAIMLGAGDAAFQATQIAVGNQSKFNWGQLAASAITGAIMGPRGLLEAPANAWDAVKKAVQLNAVRQNVNMTLGLQKKFDWTGLAVAGVAGGVAHGVGSNTWVQAQGNMVGAVITGTASALASAATKSLLTRQDFGQSLREVLPDAIGSTIGSMITGAMTRKPSGESASEKTEFERIRDSTITDSAPEMTFLQRVQRDYPEAEHAFLTSTGNGPAGADGYQTLRAVDKTSDQRGWWDKFGDWLGFDGQFGSQGSTSHNFTLSGPLKAVSHTWNNNSVEFTDSETTVVIVTGRKVWRDASRILSESPLYFSQGMIDSVEENYIAPFMAGANAFTEQAMRFGRDPGGYVVRAARATPGAINVLADSNTWNNALKPLANFSPSKFVSDRIDHYRAAGRADGVPGAVNAVSYDVGYATPIVAPIVAVPEVVAPRLLATEALEGAVLNLARSRGVAAVETRFTMRAAAERAGAVEFAGGPQAFTADLSNVTGKTAAARNRAIGAIINEDFGSLRLTHTPEYSPFLRTGIAQEGTGTQIGKLRFSNRSDLRNTIVHEELHHRWWERGIYDHHPPGSVKEAKFYETIERYERMRGW